MLFCVVLLLVMLIFTCWKRCFRFISCSCALIAVIALGGAAVFAGIYTLSFPFINESFDIGILPSISILTNQNGITGWLLPLLGAAFRCSSVLFTCTSRTLVAETVELS